MSVVAKLRTIDLLHGRRHDTSEKVIHHWGGVFNPVMKQSPLRAAGTPPAARCLRGEWIFRQKPD